MINAGKKNVLGILVDAVDYEAAIDFVMRAARERRNATISALAVHGLMTGALDREHKYRLNHFSLVTPDGMPVRWAVNLLYKTGLPDRVYGPNLTLALCARAAREGLPLFFYGSTPKILDGLRSFVESEFPGIIVAGMEPSRFRRLTPQEKIEVADRIRESGAAITFVGLGCPRQEIFAYEFRDLLPMPVLAVGAAFPFLGGEVAQAPRWLQDWGLEWVYRWIKEPRLWRRYVFLNPAYLVLLALQKLGLSSFKTDGISPSGELLYG